MRIPFAAVLPLFFAASLAPIEAQSDAKAQELAQAVWKASGGDNWARVSELHFTFIVEDAGKQLIAAEHHWDLKANTDHVKWKDKEATVNLASPPPDGDGKAAYARWVNDSYWLLAPLKVLDPGVKLAHEGQREIDGVVSEVLRLSFEQVGLTPTDQYVFYVDPETKLLRAWDYIAKEGEAMRATWDKYETFGGLKLATEYGFNGKIIRFANVRVTPAG